MPLNELRYEVFSLLPQSLSLDLSPNAVLTGRGDARHDCVAPGRCHQHVVHAHAPGRSAPLPAGPESNVSFP